MHAAERPHPAWLELLTSDFTSLSQMLHRFRGAASKAQDLLRSGSCQQSDGKYTMYTFVQLKGLRGGRPTGDALRM